ncbi:MAG: NAD(P)-binding domain-containing protein [Lewinellaceae bacterium]|nr:NAD(P)-binding domain-containing protein [Lewinellaceae bacterium]
MMSKKIGILGSGAVAKALGTGFVQHGYEVKLGTRDASKLADWQAETGGKAHVGSVAEAAAFGDAIVLAVKGTAVEKVLQHAGAANLNEKTIMDATNPIAEAPPVNGVLQFFTSLDDSLMERLQKNFPGAHFVKAFNSVGSHLMVNPDFGGARPSMFICGNEESAKREVAGILDQFGWEVEDMGGAEAARVIEPLCILWCIPGFKNNQWAHAFKLLKQ